MAKATCGFDGCDKPRQGAKVLCHAHVEQVRRGGALRPLRPFRNPKGQPRAACTFEGCERPQASYELCARHAEQRREGRPLTQIRKVTSRKALVAEALAAVGPGECILWERPSGRANTHIGTKQMRASRAIWIMAYGDPGGLWVLHTCGNGMQGCVRLGHLYHGTAADNNRDRDLDGNTLRGESSANAKLTEEDVRSIRARYRPGRGNRQALADEFGVGGTTIRAVVTGQTWRHIL